MKPYLDPVVLKALRKLGGAASITQLIAETGGSRSGIQASLQRLVREKQMEQLPDRSYRIPGTGTEAKLAEARYQVAQLEQLLSDIVASARNQGASFPGRLAVRLGAAGIH